MAEKFDIASPEESGNGHALSERLERISQGLRRLRIGEESPQAAEYRDFGNGHFAVIPKGRIDKLARE